MSAVNDGGPAFARPGANWSNANGDAMGCDAALGMSIRDYMAAKAMQGVLAQSIGTALGSDPKFCAQYAYAMADEMLKARGS